MCIRDSFIGIFVIVSASFSNYHHEFIFIARSAVGDHAFLLAAFDLLLDEDLAFALELERIRATGAQIAIGMRECRAYIRSRAVAVIGQRFAVDGNARRTIAFVDDRFIVRRILTGCLL